MSQPDRITIYVSPSLATALAERPGHEDRDSRSGTIASMCARYAEICRRMIPVLTVPEWSLICDALNGVWLIEEVRGHSAASMIEMEIADAISLDGLDKKWDVDGRSLVARLHALTYPERVALIDVVERFWADTTGDAGDRVLADAAKRGAGRSAREAALK